MVDALASILRMIQRDQVVRGAKKEPPPSAVRRILDLIAEHNLAADATMRKWIVALANQNDYGVGIRLLKLARKLIADDYPDEALRILRGIVDTATENDATVLGRRDLGHLAGLEELILTPGVVSKYSKTWGSTIISFQRHALRGHQEAEWPRTRDFRKSWNKKFGAVYNLKDDYEPDYDDHADHWYYRSGRAGHDMRGVLARAIERGLKAAVRFQDGKVFGYLCERLLESQWSLSVSQVLVALLDQINDASQPTSWQYETSAHALADALCVSLVSTTNFRRLLRIAVMEHLNVERRLAIVDCIRTHAPNDVVRMYELADVQEWGLLSPDEIASIEELRKEDKIFAPYDPREIPAVTSSWAPTERREEGFATSWPHSEDHERIRVLAENQGPPDSATPQEIIEWLEPRADFLRVLVGRQEAVDDEWFGEFSGWCKMVISVLKRLSFVAEGAQSATVRSGAEKYLASLAEHAPWWQDWAAHCLACLQRDVPTSHQEYSADNPVWSSGDQFYTSLSYLDEALAVQRAPELDTLRENLGEIVANRWSIWPAFTHATVLIILRPFHWATIRQLTDVLKEVAAKDEHVSVLEQAVHHLLKQGSPDIPELLKQLWQRLESVSDGDRIARLIGEVIGNATLRFRADQEENAVLELLSDWGDELRANECGSDPMQPALAVGITWGAKEHLGNVKGLSRRHGDHWLPIVKWAACGLLDTGCPEFEQVIRGTMSVLEYNWPELERRRLFEELGELLERVIREGDVGQYSMLHHQLNEELRACTGRDSQRSRPVALSDELLLRLCKASADRVARWRHANETTNDLAFGASIWGGDTSDLIKLTFECARDRDFVRRELPGVIDVLASASLTSLATELRLKIRQT